MLQQFRISGTDIATNPQLWFIVYVPFQTEEQSREASIAGQRRATAMTIAFILCSI
jgi:hypothetical protein